MDRLKKWNKIAIIFTVAVLSFLLLPAVFAQGMFLDGVVYSTISRNLAEGVGSFWHLHYTSVIYPVFYEHPPLSFYIQSIVFKIAGDTMFAERIYSILTAIINALLIAKIWITLFTKTDKRTFWWIPVILFFATPVVFWSFKNNMIENTLSVFILSSFLFSFYTVNSKGKKTIRFCILAGIFTCAAFLTKGPVGLLPLAFPFLIGIFKYNIKPKQIALNSIVIMIPGILLIALIFLNPSASDFFKHYFNVQVFKSIHGDREITAEGHFYLIYRLLGELLPMIGIAVLLFALRLKKNIRLFRENRKNRNYIYMFIVLGISGSFPLLISPKQHGYYLVPAMVFFAFAFGIIIYPIICSAFKNTVIGKKTFTFLKIISSLLLIGSVIFSVAQFGRYSRDEALLKDIDKIKAIVPKNTSIAIPSEMYNDWTLHAYMMRNAHISLNCDDKNLIFILHKKDSQLPVPAEYKKIDIQLEKLELYKK